MSKLFVLCFAILSLICGTQCTPSYYRRETPSSKPGYNNHVTRGLCDYVCPGENAMGMNLNEMSADSTRLYCDYDIKGTDSYAFCVYNRNTGELLSSSYLFECEQATFHCPGTKNGQEGMKWSPSPPQDSRSVNLPRYVKARTEARRALQAENA